MLLTRCAVALILLLGAFGLPLPAGLAPATAHADVVGGVATAYNLIDASVSSTRLTVPWFAFGWDGWSSVLALQNPTPVGVTVTVTARDGVSPDAVASVTVPARGVVSVNGSDLGVVPGFAGALSLVGGPISAMVDHYGNGRNRVSLPALPGDGNATTATAPLLYHGYRGWSTTLAVANTADTPNEVEVTLRPLQPRADGRNGPWLATLTLPAGAAGAVPLDDTPADLLLAATIRSTNGRPLVAATLNLSDRGAASAAPAFTRGASTLYLSLLYREANGYSSDVLVQNIGTLPATPELRLASKDGPLRRFRAPAPLAPGASHVFRLGELDGLPAGFVGAGSIAAVETGPGVELLALAHQQNMTAGTAMMLPAAPAGTSALLAPILYGDYAGYASGLQIANVDTAPATVSVTFYDSFGNRLADAETVTVAAGRPTSIYVLATAGVPAGFVGSATVNAGSGRKILVSATHVRPASADTTLAVIDAIPFHRLESGGTNLYFSDGVPQERVQASLDGLQLARREIPRALNLAAPTDPIDLFLFPSNNAYRRARAILTATPLQQVPTFSEGVFAPLGQRTAVLEDVGGPYRTPGSVAQLIAHEYTHQVIDLAVKGRAIPRWFNEGLANWAAYDTIKKRYPLDADRQMRSWRGVAASALALDARIPLTSMTSYQQWVDLGNGGRDDVIYGEAVLAIDRMIETWGTPSVAQLLKQVGGGMPFDLAFGAVTGGSVDDFDTSLARVQGVTLPLEFPTGVSALPNSGAAGTTFSFLAVGWKPRQSIEVTITRPNGTKLTFPVITSAVGFLDWSFATTGRSLPGTWRASFDGDGGDQGEVRFAVVGTNPTAEAPDPVPATAPAPVQITAPLAPEPVPAPAEPDTARAQPAAGAVSTPFDLLRSLPLWQFLRISST